MDDTTTEDCLLTVEATAAYLGLTTAALYSARHIGSDLPPAYRLGSRLRYRRSDLDKWLDAHRETPRPAIGLREATS